MDFVSALRYSSERGMVHGWMKTWSLEMSRKREKDEVKCEIKCCQDASKSITAHVSLGIYKEALQWRASNTCQFLIVHLALVEGSVSLQNAGSYEVYECPVYGETPHGFKSVIISVKKVSGDEDVTWKQLTKPIELWCWNTTKSVLHC